MPTCLNLVGEDESTVLFFCGNQLVHGEGSPQIEIHLSLEAAALSVQQLRSSHSLRFPAATSSRHLSSFLCKTIPVWNRLSPSIFVSVTSSSSFQRHRRTLFADDCFSVGLQAPMLFCISQLLQLLSLCQRSTPSISLRLLGKSSLKIVYYYYYY